MALEDEVQRSVVKLLQRNRQHTEGEVRAFVSELLTAAARERAAALQDGRRVAESVRQKAVREEGGRVRAEVEKTWAAKLREVSETADERLESGLREAREESDRRLTVTVAGVRGEGQKVLAAALEAARLESDRTLVLQVDQVREEAEEAISTELAAWPVLAAQEPTVVESDRSDPDLDVVLGRLLDGVRRLDRASRLTEVLDTLSELVGNEVPRAAVFTVQADRVRGWQFIGFGSTLDEVEARHVDLAYDEAGLVGRAVVTADACSVLSGPHGVPADAEPSFTTLPTGVQALAAPVVVGGQVMAVVYGDDAERRPAAAWRESLELLARHAGHCLEVLTAERAAQLALQDADSPGSGDTGPTQPFDVPSSEPDGLEPEA